MNTFSCQISGIYSGNRYLLITINGNPVIVRYATFKSSGKKVAHYYHGDEDRTLCNIEGQMKGHTYSILRCIHNDRPDDYKTCRRCINTYNELKQYDLHLTLE